MSDNTPYIWTPPAELLAQSNLTAFLRTTGERDYDSLAVRAEADPAWLMQEVFKFCDVRFYRPYDRMLDVSQGEAVGALVRRRNHQHRAELPGQASRHRGVGPDLSGVGRRTQAANGAHSATANSIPTSARLARGLRDIGIGRGDVVAIYMPNLPETFVAFFAILKLGAIVMPLFSGFGPAPIQSRLNHGEAKAVITANGTWRRGAPAQLKSVLDAALEGGAVASSM